MFSVPDALAGIYLGAFLLGLVFVAVSALIGFGHDLLHVPGLHAELVHHGPGDAIGHAGPGHGDVGHGDASHPGLEHGGLVHGAGGAAGHGYDQAGGGQRVTPESPDGQVAQRVWASPLNLMTVMAFLTWFGAGGYIFYVVLRWWAPLTLVLALLPGLLAGWLVFLFLIKVLLPGTLSGDVSNRHVVGQLARVSMAIPAQGIGEVVYTLDGARHSDGAASVDGRLIATGSEVVIVGFKKGIAQVELYDRFR